MSPDQPTRSPELKLVYIRTTQKDLHSNVAGSTYSLTRTSQNYLLHTACTREHRTIAQLSFDLPTDHNCIVYSIWKGKAALKFLAHKSAYVESFFVILKQVKVHQGKASYILLHIINQAFNDHKTVKQNRSWNWRVRCTFPHASSFKHSMIGTDCTGLHPPRARPQLWIQFRYRVAQHHWATKSKLKTRSVIEVTSVW